MDEWKLLFDVRQLNEIEFCTIYAEKFNHGTDGHNIRLIVAKMARLLDEAEKRTKVPGQKGADA